MIPFIDINVYNGYTSSPRTRGDLRKRCFMEFLDWAYEAGLLRLAGVAVQFRHQELPDWLLAAGGDAPVMKE